MKKIFYRIIIQNKLEKGDHELGVDESTMANLKHHTVKQISTVYKFMMKLNPLNDSLVSNIKLMRNENIYINKRLVGC